MPRSSPWIFRMPLWCAALLLSCLVAACDGDSAAGGGGGGGGGGGAGTSSGTVTADITALTGTQTYALLYSGTQVGVDVRNVTATFDVNKAMAAYHFSSSEALQAGSNSVAERAGDADVNVGRWNGGTTTGTFYASPAEHMTLTSNQGFHYALAVKPNHAGCSGSSVYTLTSATAPTQGDGGVAPGTVSSVTATVTFAVGSPTINIAVNYTLGSPISYASSNLNFADNSLDLYSIVDIGSPNTIVELAFGGPGREKLAFAYHRYSGAGGSASSISFTGYMTRTTDSSVDCP